MHRLGTTYRPAGGRQRGIAGEAPLSVLSLRCPNLTHRHESNLYVSGGAQRERTGHSLQKENNMYIGVGTLILIIILILVLT